MCLIVYKPKEANFNLKTLFNGWNMNSDGAGFMVNDGTTFIQKKGFFTYFSLLNALEQYNNNNFSIVVHFRWATHGEKDMDNCHPFAINDGLAMVHNGVLNVNIEDKRYSDTWHFAQICKRVAKNNPEFWIDPALKKMTESLIRKNNKFVFMNKDHVEIYNEAAGTWLDGCWYSNTLFTFGNWKEFEKAQNRSKIRNAGYVTPPIHLNNAAVEGKEWFNCQNCYGDYFKKDDKCHFINGFILCVDCFKEISWSLASGVNTKLCKNFVESADVDEMLKLLDEQEKARKKEKKKERANECCAIA